VLFRSVRSGHCSIQYCTMTSSSKSSCKAPSTVAPVPSHSRNNSSNSVLSDESFVDLYAVIEGRARVKPPPREDTKEKQHNGGKIANEAGKTTKPRRTRGNSFEHYGSRDRNDKERRSKIPHPPSQDRKPARTSGMELRSSELVDKTRDEERRTNHPTHSHERKPSRASGTETQSSETTADKLQSSWRNLRDDIEHWEMDPLYGAPPPFLYRNTSSGSATRTDTWISVTNQVKDAPVMQRNISLCSPMSAEEVINAKRDLIVSRRPDRMNRRRSVGDNPNLERIKDNESLLQESLLFERNRRPQSQILEQDRMLQYQPHKERLRPPSRMQRRRSMGDVTESDRRLVNQLVRTGPSLPDPPQRPTGGRMERYVYDGERSLTIHRPSDDIGRNRQPRRNSMNSVSTTSCTSKPNQKYLNTLFPSTR